MQFITLVYFKVNFAMINYDIFTEILTPSALGQSRQYKDYLHQMIQPGTWGDSQFLSVIVKMFKIGVTIISPYLENPINIFHDKDDPEVVIVANGNLHGENSTTHFSATRK